MEASEREAGTVPGNGVSPDESIEEPLSFEPEPPAKDDTLLDRFRQKRDDISKNTLYTLDIPGYDGELVVKYRRTPDIWDRMKKIAQRMESSKNPRVELIGMCDVLINSCEGIFIRANNVLNPLNEALAERGLQEEYADLDEPIKYDDRLRTFLAIGHDEAKSAREVVMRVFVNDLALTAHYGELQEWFNSSRKQDAEDF
jgi:hypothetical protein